MADVQKTSIVFFTGFPGFIGYNLIKRLLVSDAGCQFRLLVEARLVPLCQAELQKLEQEIPGAISRCEIIPGDITDTKLGLSEELRHRLAGEITHAYHLAAIYDLAVPSEMADKINVDGTRFVLDFLETAKSFERLIYFSTCYVAGLRQGRILETELKCGQKFKNHYESTKYAAEVLVQESRIPSVIIRPSIVVGHSQTGETRKYDGPYFMIQLLLNLPKWLPMIHIGSGQVALNLVPVDYIIDGTLALATAEGTQGRVYALADPNPLPVRQLWSLLLELTGHRRPLFTLPLGLVKFVMQFSWVRNLLKIPQEVLGYFDADMTLDTTHAVSTLKPLGVVCPHTKDYMGRLIDFVRKHPEINPIRKPMY